MRQFICLIQRIGQQVAGCRYEPPLALISLKIRDRLEKFVFSPAVMLCSAVTGVSVEIHMGVTIS